jgi:hypothetical protein
MLTPCAMCCEKHSPRPLLYDRSRVMRFGRSDRAGTPPHPVSWFRLRSRIRNPVMLPELQHKQARVKMIRVPAGCPAQFANCSKTLAVLSTHHCSLAYLTASIRYAAAAHTHNLVCCCQVLC